MMFFVGSQFSSVIQLSMYCFILFIGCVVCHGELRRLAPTQHSLTLFYLYIAAGGAIGSLFTALFAPMLFDRVTEYALALLLIVIFCGFAMAKSSVTYRLGWAALVVVSTLSYYSLETMFNQYNVASTRNFYGYIAVKDIEVGNILERRLVDGTTVHGSQSLENDMGFESSYYQQDSGVALAFDYLQQDDALNIGIIGLGAGVLADFSRDNDTLRFYELNPAVHSMADKYFSYLRNAKGDVDVTIADGRLALEQRLTANESAMDALVIDAFSSDVIPSHLLTQEALSLYWQSLTQDGLLIIHISNNHIDLMPVIKAHSQHFKKQLVRFNKSGGTDKGFGSDWVVLTSDKRFADAMGVKSLHTSPVEIANNLVNWTDEHYSILPLIKFSL